MRQLESNVVDCIITDPPYFIDKLDNNWNEEVITKGKQKAGVVGGLPVGMKFDKRQGERLQEYMGEIAEEMYRVIKSGGFCLVFSQARLTHRMTMAFEEAGFEIRDLLFWRRRSQPKAFSQNHFVRRMKIPEETKEELIKTLANRKTPQLMQEIETIILCQKPREGTFINNWIEHGVGLINVDFEEGFPSTLLEYTRDLNIKHLTPKPVALIEKLLEIFTKEGDLVLDSFMGSGSTAIGCINTNRNYIGYEIDEGNYNIAQTRVKEHKREV